MHHGSTGRIKTTTEVYTTWLEKTYLTVIKMKVNGVVKLKHTLMYIDEKTIVHWTTSHLTFIDMVNVPKLINSEHLDMTSIP